RPLATAIHHYTAAATTYNTPTAVQPSVATAVTTAATKMVFAWGGRQQGGGGSITVHAARGVGFAIVGVFVSRVSSHGGCLSRVVSSRNDVFV
nr:hypothetical protein [Tanacetum cinerariifolium]